MKVHETDQITVAEVLHKLSGELSSLQQTLETAGSSSPSAGPGSPVTSPKGPASRQTFFQRMGPLSLFRKGSPRQGSPSGSPKATTPRRKNLVRIKDYGLYWPAKDEWLHEDLEVAHYCFREGALLEYKCQVRDFKHRIQYEIKLLFPQWGWTKSITVSPYRTTVNVIRAKAIAWLKEEDLIKELRLEQGDDRLSLFGIYLRGALLEDESKVLSTYQITQRETLEIKYTPGYSFEIRPTQENGESALLIHLSAKSSFESLIDKMQRNYKLSKDQTLTVVLPSPLGRLDSSVLDLSRALLQTGTSFTVECSSDPPLVWSVSVVRVPKDSTTTTESRIPSSVLFEGEKVEDEVSDKVLALLPAQGESVKHSVKVFRTNYRLLLERKFQSNEGETWMSIPFLSISFVQKLKSKDKRDRKNRVDIFCKNIRKVTLHFVDSPQRKRFYLDLLEVLARHVTASLFAYAYLNPHNQAAAQPHPGWDRYDARAEYARLGVLSFNMEKFGWRLTQANKNYEVCPTYPSLLAVPAQISDDVLRVASTFRTKSRLPSLSWVHPTSGACLCRSSQPKVGLQRNTSREDQEFLFAIAEQGLLCRNPELGRKERQIHIFDARPIKAAMGNTVMGAGYESDNTGYNFCEAHFLNIGMFSFRAFIVGIINSDFAFFSL